MYGVAKYWSGTAQQVKKGLEAGRLEIVDVEERTACSLEVVQTPVPREEGNLVKHYTKLIVQRVTGILPCTPVLSVSVVKYQTWAQRPDKEEVPFSMRSVKTFCLNQYMTGTISSNLALDPSARKIKRLYHPCLNIGTMAT